MGTELLMPLYKQWGVTHYTFDIIVLTSSEKSFSLLHHRIFLMNIVPLPFFYYKRIFCLFYFIRKSIPSEIEKNNLSVFLNIGVLV